MAKVVSSADRGGRQRILNSGGIHHRSCCVFKRPSAAVASFFLCTGFEIGLGKGEAMKRKLKWLAIVLAVLLLGFGTALLLWPRDRITAESWQKIRIGMTEEEVAEILGGPGVSLDETWAQYDRLQKQLNHAPWQFEDPHLAEPADKGLFVVGERDKIWTGRRGMIEIEFDQENRVCWKSFRGVRWINEGILDRLRDWLGW